MKKFFGILLLLLIVVVAISFSKNDSIYQKYCGIKGKTYVSIRDCGAYKVVKAGCCDIPDIILAKNGAKIMSCGGFSGYSEVCKIIFPQKNCTEIQCSSIND